jgi:hypothetical protein
VLGKNKTFNGRRLAPKFELLFVMVVAVLHDCLDYWKEWLIAVATAHTVNNTNTKISRFDSRNVSDAVAASRYCMLGLVLNWLAAGTLLSRSVRTGLDGKLLAHRTFVVRS